MYAPAFSLQHFQKLSGLAAIFLGISTQISVAQLPELSDCSIGGVDLHIEIQRVVVASIQGSELEVPGPWGHWWSNIIQVGLLHEWWENLQQQHIMPWHNVVWTKEKTSWNGDVCAIWCTWSPTPILHTCLWLLNWCQKDPEIGHVLSTLGSVVTMRLFIGHLNTYTLRIPRIPSSHPPWT